MTNHANYSRNIIHEKFNILMNESINNPGRNFVYSYHPSGDIHAYHNHRFYEINVVLEGSAENNVSGDKIKMNKGDAILLHPDAFHQLYCDKNSTVVNFLIYPEFLVFALSSAHPDSPLGQFISSCNSDDYNHYIFFGGGTDDTSCFMQLISKIKCNVQNGSTDLFEEEGLFLMMWSFLMQKKSDIFLSSHKGGNTEHSHNALMNYTFANFNTVTLDILAEKFNYSRSHICRIFKHHTGKTFTDFLNTLRLSKATELLVYYNYSVQDIASKTGFQSIEHFHRLFKKRFGTSPLQYRILHNKSKPKLNL